MEKTFKYMYKDEWKLTDSAIYINDKEIILSPEVELDSFTDEWGCCGIWLHFRGERFVLYYPSGEFDAIGYIEQYATFSEKYIKEKAKKVKERVKWLVFKICWGLFLISAVVSFITIFGKIYSAMYITLYIMIAMGVLALIATLILCSEAFSGICEKSVYTEYGKKKKTNDDGTKQIVKGALIGGIVAGGSGAIVGAIVALNKHLEKKDKK